MKTKPTIAPFCHVVHSYRGMNFETELNLNSFATENDDRRFVAKVDFKGRVQYFSGASRDEATKCVKKVIDLRCALEKARSCHADFDRLPL